jgi:hypothetical protein
MGKQMPVSCNVAAAQHGCAAAATQVDMTDVLKVKHARHNAQPSARQQQQQDGPTGTDAGLRSLGLAAGKHQHRQLLAGMLLPAAARQHDIARAQWLKHLHCTKGCSFFY